jgi:uncharacterized repeat protein (TIGR02543 family)
MVTFNPNGGIVTPTTRTVQAGQAVGALPIPTRQGFTFVGWFTTQTGGTQINANTVVSGNVTYWARWNATVTFNLNQGIFNGSANPIIWNIWLGETVGTLPTPTREGFTFAGWFMTPGATGNAQLYADMESSDAQVYEVTPFSDTPIHPGTIITGNMNLWARWTPLAPIVTVTFNLNGGTIAGSGDAITRNIPAGQSFGTAMPTPTRTGYSFDGWFIVVGAQIYPDTVINGNMILWARWTQQWSAGERMMRSPVFTVRFDPYMSTALRTAFVNAMWDWTQSDPGIRITENVFSANLATFIDASESHYRGSVQPYPLFPGLGQAPIPAMNSFTIRVNIAHGAGIPNYWRSVAGHEFGHTLGLGDVFAYPAVVIMNPDRDRTRIFTPQPGDVAGVRHIQGLR